MNTVYFGLGSNQNNPPKQLQLAINSLHSIIEIEQISSIYRSPFEGASEQEDVYNLALKAKTELSAQQLLTHCQAIEEQQRRQRTLSLSARTIDIDLLFFNDDTICDDNLIIPHPKLITRGFVLLPLYEITPEICLPNGRQIQAYITKTMREKTKQIGKLNT